jgi:hypothetical protein
MSSKIKIFHSMPLAGRTEEQIQRAREWQHVEAKRTAARIFGVKQEDCEILPTFINETPGKEYKTEALWYFGKGVMEYLSRADLLALADDYASARGCRMERAVAEAYGIPSVVLPQVYSSEVSDGTD